MAGLKCEGCQLGLESLQRCLAHCYLQESIPQHDRSGEQTLMVAGERCWNLHKTCVMASGSVVKGSQVPFRGDRHAVLYTIFKLEPSPSLTTCLFMTSSCHVLDDVI